LNVLTELGLEFLVAELNRRIVDPEFPRFIRTDTEEEALSLSKLNPSNIYFVTIEQEDETL